MQNFKNLKVWQNGIVIAKEIYELTRQFPNEEKYGLASQMNRAAVSIPSNIAEGTSRSSSKEHKRFLQIALGSAFELETQLVLVKELEIISEANLSAISKRINEEQRMLYTLINRS